MAASFQVFGAVIYVAVIKESIVLSEIATAIAVENFLGSIATVVLFACMMDWSKSTESGMNFTVLASAVVGVQGFGSIFSGLTASGLGYTGHHVLAGVLALVGGMWAASSYRDST